MANRKNGGSPKRVERLTDDELNALAVCLNHAQDLLVAADAVLSVNKPNIAYHLAALALEEIGRHELLLLERGASREPIPPTWPVRHRQDHVQKLFWSFFGAAFGRKPLTKQAWEEMREIAQVIHATRIAGLYAEDEQGRIQVPRDAIAREQAESLVAMARARFGMIGSYEARKRPSDAERALQEWFLTISSDDKKRAVLFAPASMAKLAELQDAHAWMTWLKGQLDAAEAEARQIVEREFARGLSADFSSATNKWRIRIKLASSSHYVAPKALRFWNDGVAWIKLEKAAGKREVYVDLLLPESITIQTLWWTGWAAARMFTAALNIGTRGLWWWQLATDLSRYYEAAEDLQTRQAIELDRSPPLRVDWGTNVLNEDDLRRTIQAFTVLVRLRPEQRQPYDYYVAGIQLWAKLDVHFPCEPDIYGNFDLSLKGMMRAAGAWDGHAPFGAMLPELLPRLSPDLGEDQIVRFVELANAFDAGQPDGHNIALTDVAAIKLICDYYFLSVIIPHEQSLMNPSGTSEHEVHGDG
jgi:AbiV family abortive infection protein